MTVHAILCAARNSIDNTGWVQEVGDGEWRFEGRIVRGHCAANAVCQHTLLKGDSSGYSRATDVLLAAIGGESLPDLFDWNDSPDRTKEEVLAAFDRAIQATAPPPAFESLGQEPATEREPVIEVFA